MDQKTRNKIAWILTVVLVPTMIYLMVANIVKVRTKRRAPLRTETPSAAEIDSMGVLPPVSQPKPAESKAETVDSEVLKEQKKVAAALPKCNPFDASRKSTSTSPRVEAGAEKKGQSFKLNGIMDSKGTRMAVINGRVLKAGESIEGWTLVEITNNSVTLDNGAEKMTLQLRR